VKFFVSFVPFVVHRSVQPSAQVPRILALSGEP
jgi:hypothetical protein